MFSILFPALEKQKGIQRYQITAMRGPRLPQQEKNKRLEYVDG